MAAIASAAKMQTYKYKTCQLVHADCFDWLAKRKEHSVHAVVTDPPYGLVEYSSKEKAKLRKGRGGVWRIPPSFDGCQRAPLPRFTTLTQAQLDGMYEFFSEWATLVERVLVPGGHVLVASNPLVTHIVANGIDQSGLESRGYIARLVMTMRGGDRPKNAHDEFQDVSVMPRSMWEPWIVFRKPIEGRVQDNLRKWGTGGFRRISDEQPFGDVIKSSPTRKTEKALAPHPSLKPQAFMRQLVRAVLPMGKGVILDPFAGSASTLAAAAHLGLDAIGIEMDDEYFKLAKAALPKLASWGTKPTNGATQLSFI